MISLIVLWQNGGRLRNPINSLQSDQRSCGLIYRIMLRTDGGMVTKTLVVESITLFFDWIFKGLYNAYFGRYATLLKYWGDGLFKAFRNTKEKRTTCLGE